MSLSFAAWSDDSYFSIARDFVANTISVETLERALFLGGLGYQVVLRTSQVFGALSGTGCAIAEGERWNPLRPSMRRWCRARTTG